MSSSNGRISIISAERGSVTERLLLMIAEPRNQPTNGRYFTQLNNDRWQGRVYHAEVDKEYPLELRLGVVEGLHLRTKPHSSKWSPKPISISGSVSILEIGAEVPESCLSRIANTIVGCWVLHGFNWVDGSGAEFTQPYGRDPANLKKSRKRSRGRRYRSSMVQGWASQ